MASPRSCAAQDGYRRATGATWFLRTSQRPYAGRPPTSLMALLRLPDSDSMDEGNGLMLARTACFLLAAVAALAALAVPLGMLPHTASAQTIAACPTGVTINVAPPAASAP